MAAEQARQKEEAARVPATLLGGPKPGLGGWAGPAAPAKSLKEIQEEEARARRAAGPQPAVPSMASMIRGGSGPMTPPPMPAAARAAAAATAAEGNGDDEDLFWNYAGPAAAAAKPTTPKPATPAADAPSGGALNNFSAGFRDFCRGKIRELTGSEDLTLVEFLLTLNSSSETAEYIELYLGKTPQAAAFTTEFLKRKLAELAGIKTKGGAASASTTPKPSGPAWANATVNPKAALQPPAAAQAPQNQAQALLSAASAPPPPAFSGDTFPSLPGAGRLGAAPGPAAPAGSMAAQLVAPGPSAEMILAQSKKKAGKGKKLVDSSLLGFSTGTDYSALES